MLTQLYIQNIAVIEQASIDFEPGFTVLTGETGAGKSIIIDAIYAVLGERTSKELVRTGAEQASVSALFTDVSPQTQQVLRELDIPLEDDGSLLIRREIRPHGRSSCVSISCALMSSRILAWRLVFMLSAFLPAF